MTSKKFCKKSLSNLNWLHYVFSILNCTWILTLHLIKNETKQICETIWSTVQQTLHRDLGEGGGSIRHNMLCRTLDLNLSEFFFKTDQLLGSLTSGMSPPNVVKMWHWFKYPVLVSSMLHLVSWTTPYTEREGTVGQTNPIAGAWLTC